MKKLVSLLVPFVVGNNLTIQCMAQSPSIKEEYMSVAKDKPSGALGVDYEYKLLRGYDITRTNFREVCINHPEGPHSNPVIAGNIVKFAVKDPYIVGVTTVLNGDPNPNAKKNAGYFVLNTSTNQIIKGLTEQKWRLELKHIGWLEPFLAEPI
jgi:hypothetical protein